MLRGHAIPDVVFDHLSPLGVAVAECRAQLLLEPLYLRVVPSKDRLYARLSELEGVGGAELYCILHTGSGRRRSRLGHLFLLELLPLDRIHHLLVRDDVLIHWPLRYRFPRSAERRRATAGLFGRRLI